MRPSRRTSVTPRAQSNAGFGPSITGRAPLAARAGQLLVPAALANELGVPRPTIVRYLALLEEAFLIKRIPAWSRNLSIRSTSTDKVAVVDSGVALR
jgi:predicted AAA+ superfamily ATPase